jgi:hypothetical protein
MRRWVFMAALSAALLVVPLWAQRGGHGGMAGGGGRGAPVGVPHGGGAWGGGVFHGGYGHGPYGHPGHYPFYPGNNRFYPWRYPWGWGYGWYGYPWASSGLYGGIGWSGASYSYPVQPDPAYVYPYPDNTSSHVADIQQREIDRLDEEVARLRAERDSDLARNSAPQPPPKAQVRAETVLVYRNHRTEEIENYAIVGKTLWVFTERRSRKIPIADLDVPATAKANDARGIDFQLPTK